MYIHGPIRFTTLNLNHEGLSGGWLRPVACVTNCRDLFLEERGKIWRKSKRNIFSISNTGCSLKIVFSPLKVVLFSLILTVLPVTDLPSGGPSVKFGVHTPREKLHVARGEDL